MNDRGFTLIELLAVLSILSLLLIIATVSLSNVAKDSKTDLSNAQIESIKQAAASWSADNMNKLPNNNSCSYINLNDLIENGLLDEEIFDLKDRKKISNRKTIKIKIISRLNNSGNSILSYEVNPNNTDDCTYIGEYN